MQALVLPHVKEYHGRIEPLLTSADPLKRLEAVKCHGALLSAASRFVADQTVHVHTAIGRSGAATGGFGANAAMLSLLPDVAVHYSDLYDVFGEALLAQFYSKDSVPHAMML